MIVARGVRHVWAVATLPTQVDIADVENSRQVHSIPCSAPMNSVSWHPTRHLLAYAGDDKNKSGQDEGSLRVFGFS